MELEESLRGVGDVKWKRFTLKNVFRELKYSKLWELFLFSANF